MSGSAGRLVTPGIEPVGEPFQLLFEGRAIAAREGESVAAALTAAGIVALREAEGGEARGVFCGMGVCFECLVEVDGRANQRACMTKARAGMQVRVARECSPTAGDGAPLGTEPDGPLALEAADLLIVGAGPAGLAAALSASRAGARVRVLDERPLPGGQYFKQLAPGHVFTAAPDRQFAQGQALLREVVDAGVRIDGEATVWGAWDHAHDGVELGVLRAGSASRLRARSLIVATGAYERPHRVPGWTLPGVMTTGAAQTFGRAYRVAPGRRALIAGNGPLNLQVACELARGGVEVVAVVEAARRPGPRALPALAAAFVRSPGLVRDGLGYIATLARHGVAVVHGHVLERVDGAGRAERATVVRIDADGRPLAVSRRTFDVDVVCMGYGFLPSNELTRLLGCRHRFDPVVGALVAECDEDGATSLPMVFAVGDCTGLGGARVARSQGTLAGIAAARGLGFADADPASGVRARRALVRDRGFQRALWTLFDAPAPGDALVTDETLLCRCEAVPAGVVRAHLSAGCTEIGALKRMTRVGMGRCQGRYCGPLLARLCAEANGSAPDEFAAFAPRFPSKPVPAVALASEKPEWREAEQGMAPPAVGPPARGDGQPRHESADVAVLGAGIIGLCAAYYLAREGVDVVLLERGQPNGEASGNNAGSLHVQLLAYDFGERAELGGGPAAEVLPLQRESTVMWPELERSLGEDLEIEITGGLMLAEDPARLGQLERKAALERRYGTEVEILSARELRDLAPSLDGRMAGAAWCPAEGKINPMRAGPAVLDAAVRAGARLFAETTVQAIERGATGFAITTDRGTVTAGKVLNACGGWSARIAAMVGTSLPTRANPIQLIVTEPARPLVRHLLAYADRHLTVKQVRNGNLVIGGGWPAALDPRTGRPTVLEDSLEGNLWVASRAVPELRTLHVLRSWAAMNVAIDGAPILGETPGLPGFYNAVTVNGVTLGPVIGRLTSEAMRSGRTPPGMAGFTLSRF